jgi:CheY-like chemotaxis protein/anti-sigma regulatory factor (Ser/Thr protein kinase)
VQQIFTNLITNAIKFTPDQGSVEVVLQKGSGNVSVSIKDTGKGIDAEALPFIFERFFQARINESADKSGLGLGLSIVYSLVKQHGGTVIAESGGNGMGSVFTVTFPVLEMSASMTEELESRDVEPEELNGDPLQKIHVLLVEDNDDSREVLQMFLEQMGAEITPAGSAAEAIKSLNANGSPPDVLISDISMPDEDGYSLIKKVRKLPAVKGGNMPAIALTAFTSPEDKRRILNSGFQIHHSKPFEPDLLIREILGVLKRS